MLDRNFSHPQDPFEWFKNERIVSNLCSFREGWHAIILSIFFRTKPSLHFNDVKENHNRNVIQWNSHWWNKNQSPKTNLWENSLMASEKNYLLLCLNWFCTKKVIKCLFDMFRLAIHQVCRNYHEFLEMFGHQSHVNCHYLCDLTIIYILINKLSPVFSA